MSALTDKLRLVNGAYRETVAASGSAGASIRTLTGRYNALSESLAKAQGRQAALDANMNAQRALSAQRSELTGRLLGAAAQTVTVAAPLKLSVDAEDAFADLTKLMDGASDEMKRQTFDDALRLTDEVRVSAPDAVEYAIRGKWFLRRSDATLTSGSQQALRYEQFIAPLIKAVQEQQAQIEALKAEIAVLKAGV